MYICIMDLGEQKGKKLRSVLYIPIAAIEVLNML